MSNDEFSFLKDRHYTLAICINGQLLLTTLFEEIINKIPNSKLIMCNTDGFEVLIPREYENLYYESNKSANQKPGVKVNQTNRTLFLESLQNRLAFLLNL